MNAPVNSYSLNADNARQVGANSFIDQKGAYVGFFTRAERVISDKGTQGIEFDFKSRDGATANYLTVWTQNGEGKELYGRKIVDGILTSLGLRSISTADATVKRYNHETRKEENARAVVFPELMGKAIGVVLVREEYEGQGGRKWKNLLACPYEAATGRLPIERLDNKPAEGLERILATLRDRPLKEGARRGGAQQSGGGSRSMSGAAQGSGFDDMDDDIPF